MTLRDEQGGNGVTCQQVEDSNMIERYLSEKLSDEEVQTFEKHYLECKRCFDELQLCHAATIELTHSGPPPTVMPSRLPLWRWAAIAAALLLAVVLTTVYFRPVAPPSAAIPPTGTGQPDPEVLPQLASADLPPYVSSQVRGAETTKARQLFETGMAAYSQGDCGKAIEPLTQATQLDPANDPATFYLGICYLSAMRPDDALSQLSKLTAPQNPYSEESHWYSAIAHLQRKDANRAKAELDIVVSMNRAFAPDASNLLKRIRDLGFR